MAGFYMNPERLKEEIQIEIKEMTIVIDDINSLMTETNLSSPTNIQKAAASSLVAQFYCGIENILKRISKFHNINLPKGENWHIELFNRFCELNETKLPILFNGFLRDELINYRKFRHFVFHGYSNKISWERLLSGIRNINDVFSNFKDSINIYLR
jgi:hypothetical protein